MALRTPFSFSASFSSSAVGMKLDRNRNVQHEAWCMAVLRWQPLSFHRRSFCDLGGDEGKEGQGTYSGLRSAWTQLSRLQNGTTLSVLKDGRDSGKGTNIY